MKRQRTSRGWRARRFAPLLIGGLFASGGALLAACGGGAGASTSIETDAVHIENFAFSPTSVTVKAGSTVMWVNDDPIGHDVTLGTGGVASSTLDQHDTFSYRFPTAGTYDYICSIHPFMRGTVIVTS